MRIGLYVARFVEHAAAVVPTSYAFVGWRTALYIGGCTGAARMAALYGSLNRPRSATLEWVED